MTLPSQSTTSLKPPETTPMLTSFDMEYESLPPGAIRQRRRTLWKPASACLVGFGLALVLSLVVTVVVLFARGNNNSKKDGASTAFPPLLDNTDAPTVRIAPLTDEPLTAAPSLQPTAAPTPVPTFMAADSTPSPTSALAPRPTQLQTAIDWLTGDQTGSDPEVFDSQSSPQYQAAYWLAHVDEYSQTKFPPNDWVKMNGRYALLILYFSMKGNQTGMPWPNFQDECSWQEFMGEYYKSKVRCNSASHIEEMLMNGTGIVGPLPAEVGLFRDIKQLKLPDNKITGPLDSVKQLSNLVWLDIGKNDYVGTIPEWIGHIRPLRILDMSYNQVSGSLPSSLADSNQMRMLYLNHNMLSGPLDVLSRIVQLTHINLFNNQFSGSLGDSFLSSNIDKVSVIRLQNNGLTGTLPPHLLSNHRANSLRLSNNSLTGTLPTSLTEVPSRVTYKKIDLSYNKFEGPIPDYMAQFPRLKHLDLSHNRFSGVVPSGFGQLRDLATLYIEDNAMTGPIPEDVFTAPSLQGLSFQFAGIQGSIPNTLAQATALRLLNLGFNGMVGTLAPNSFQTNQQLEYLLLNRNFFQGPLPEFDGLTNLKVVHLDSNNFSPSTSEVCSGGTNETVWIVDYATIPSKSNGPTPDCQFSCCSDAACNEDHQVFRLGLENEW